MIKRRWAATVLFAATLCFIFVHSMMPATVSAQESGGLLRILEPFLKLFLPERIIQDHFLRKAAHFSEYALLGFESGFLFPHRDSHEKQYSRSTRLGIGLFTAFTDETLQLFTEGRSGELRDMWIDLFGYVTGLLLAELLRRLLSHLRARRHLSPQDGEEAHPER